ncbi:MAG: hypothetical protein QXH60_01985 [Candidatus Pacearchaeota archaeon]
MADLMINNQGNVIISNLNGTGKAYVCVDENGKLERSLSPCGG